MSKLRLQRIAKATQQGELNIEDDPIISESKRDIVAFDSYVNRQGRSERPEAKNQTRMMSTFSRLIYYQIASLNNRGVLLHTINMHELSSTCFVKARGLRGFSQLHLPEYMQMLIILTNEVAGLARRENDLEGLEYLQRFLEDASQRVMSLNDDIQLLDNPFVEHLALILYSSVIVRHELDPRKDYSIKFHSELPVRRNLLRLIVMGYEMLGGIYNSKQMYQEGEDCNGQSRYFAQMEASSDQDNQAAPIEGLKNSNIDLGSRGQNLRPQSALSTMTGQSRPTNYSVVGQGLDLEITSDQLIFKKYVRSIQKLYKVSMYQSYRQKCVLIVVSRKPDEYIYKKIIANEEVNAKSNAKNPDEPTPEEIDLALLDCAKNIRILSDSFYIKNWATFESLQDLVTFRTAQA